MTDLIQLLKHTVHVDLWSTEFHGESPTCSLSSKYRLHDHNS